MSDSDYEILTEEANPTAAGTIPQHDSDYEVVGADEAPAQTGPSASDAIITGATKGFSLGGLGRDLAPFVSAISSTATDDELGRNYGDRVLAAKADMDKTAAQSEAAHPWMTALAQIAASIPKTVGLTAGLASKGITGAVSQGTAQGALEGITQSKKENLTSTAKDTALAAATGAVVSGALSKLGKSIAQGAKEAGIDFSTAANEFGEPIKASAIPQISKAGDEILKISYNKTAGEALQLGRDMQIALSNPEAKALITDEVNAQPQKIMSIIEETKSQIGPKYDAIVKQYGDVTGDLSKVFDKARKGVQNVFHDSDVSVEKAKGALENLINDRESSLVQKFGTLEAVPLSEMVALKQDLGNLIFEQKAFKKIGTDAVHSQATKFWGGIVDELGNVDKTKASGGTLANIDKVFKATYKMADDLPTGANLLKLSSPKAAVARADFDTFLGHWAEVPSDVRSLYGKNLTSYIQNDFSNAISKGQLMNAVDKGSSPGIKALGYIPLTSEGNINYANRLGAFLGPKAPAAAPFSNPLSNKIVNPQTLAPGLSGLASQRGQE